MHPRAMCYPARLRHFHYASLYANYFILHSTSRAHSSDATVSSSTRRDWRISLRRGKQIDKPGKGWTTRRRRWAEEVSATCSSMIAPRLGKVIRNIKIILFSRPPFRITGWCLTSPIPAKGSEQSIFTLCCYQVAPNCALRERWNTIVTSLPPIVCRTSVWAWFPGE